MNELVLSEGVRLPVQSRADYAESLKNRIGNAKKKLLENFLELSNLLAAVYNDQIYEDWGYNSFKEYVESSDLDINLGVAYRMVNMVNNIKSLDIPQEELIDIRPTKLLEIFSLNPETHKEDIKKLVSEGNKNTVDEVKEKVKKAKGDTTSDVFYRFKVDSETAEMIDLAFEKAKKIFGNKFIDQNTGTVFEPSQSAIFMAICADFLASSGNTSEAYQAIERSV